MKKLEKAVAMILSVLVIVTGSAGLTNRSDGQSTPVRQIISGAHSVGQRDNLTADTHNSTEHERKDEEFDDLRSTVPEAPFEAISRRDFVFYLTGRADSGENSGNYLTREEAAYILFAVLMNEGYEKSDGAGNLSIFPDGIDTSPQYAQAVSELYTLAVLQPSGSLLKPKDLISRLDAVEMIMRAKQACGDLSGRFMLCRLLEITVSDVEVLENMLSCVIGAILNHKAYGFSDEPDIRFSSLALYNAICRGFIPESLCMLKSETAVMITQADMQSLYSGMFAEGSFTAFDPVAADDNVTVLGDNIIFIPEKKQDITVSAGTAVREPDGSVAVCCTVYVLSAYLCTAKVVLKKTGGWAGGHSVKSVTLSMG